MNDRFRGWQHHFVNDIGSGSWRAIGFDPHGTADRRFQAEAIAVDNLHFVTELIADVRQRRLAVLINERPLRSIRANLGKIEAFGLIAAAEIDPGRLQRFAVGASDGKVESGTLQQFDLPLTWFRRR